MGKDKGTATYNFGKKNNKKEKTLILNISENFTRNLINTAVIPVGAAVLAAIIWLISGAEVSAAIKTAASVFMAMLPFAASLSVPLAFAAAKRECELNQIQINDEKLKAAAKTTAVVFEKSGVLTNGSSIVSGIIPRKCSEKELMTIAVSVESGSNHPAASAIRLKASEMGILPMPVSKSEIVPHHGIYAKLGSGHIASAGNLKMTEKLGIATGNIFMDVMNISKRGDTPLIISIDQTLLGIISISYKPNPAAKETTKLLQDMGISVYMMTGGSKTSADAFAAEIGIGKVIADIPENERINAVKQLQNSEKTVMMVGDFEKEPEILCQADIGVSLQSGERFSSSPVICVQELQDTARLIKLSRTMIKTAKQNLIFAVLYSLLSLLITAGILYPFTKLAVSPIVSLIIMTVGAGCVWLNTLKCKFNNK